MTYPINSFAVTSADRLQPGTIYFDGHGQWFMAAQRNNRQSIGAVRLTRRDDALMGAYISDVRGEVFAIAEPYAVRIEIDDYAALATEGQFLGAILVGSPHTIFCAEFERILFSFDGKEQGDDAPSGRRWRYLRWSGWLVDASGEYIGDVPLFTVDADGNVDA
ncbi:hypothetical protein I5U02_02195 [Stenotrophomonas maltophilia]|nr:hypothetical protein [Stenotrophomonas maltophilia]